MEFVYLSIGIISGFIIGLIITRLYSKNKFLSKEKDLENNIGLLQAKSVDHEEEITELKRELQIESDNREKAVQLNVKYEADYTNLEDKLNNERKQLDDLQKKFTTEFENIAHKILKQNTIEFQNTSTKSMGDILNPLKEKILNFEKKVEDTYQKGIKDQTNLLAVLKNLQVLSMRLDKDAQDLTKALKSDSKKQGNWGEVVLERMLEDSGLIKGQEYFIQETGRNEEGQIIRPDIVITLPQEKHLIIDSKVSLTAYHEFITSDKEEEKEKALKKHLESIKSHVKELNDKNYTSMSNKNIPDFVLMFMPVESAFALAVQADASLFNYAWEKKIVIVSPTTLLATLKTIEAIWRQEKQTKNALEIAEQGGKLYDKFAGFLVDLEKIGVNLGRATDSYREAHKKLSTGRGNILSHVEKMKTLGAKTSKNLPSKYLKADD